MRVAPRLPTGRLTCVCALPAGRCRTGFVKHAEPHDNQRLYPGVVINPGGFATSPGRGDPAPARCRHQPWWVRNPWPWSGSASPTAVVINPGGFATPARHPRQPGAIQSSSTLVGSQLAGEQLLRGQPRESSSTLVGSQRRDGPVPPGPRGRRHQPWWVRNVASVEAEAEQARVVINPGGFATGTARAGRRPSPWSSSPLLGSQHPSRSASTWLEFWSSSRRESATGRDQCGRRHPKRAGRPRTCLPRSRREGRGSQQALPPSQDSAGRQPARPVYGVPLESGGAGRVRRVRWSRTSRAWGCRR